MIRVTDIHKSFGTLEVLKGVSLRVARGEVVIENVLDTGVNLISTSNMLYDYFVKI